MYKKITWARPKKAKRPKTKPKSLKDLIDSALSRHNIGRQVSASVVVERMNMHLWAQDGMHGAVRVISFQFGKMKVGITHRLFQEKVRAHEEKLQNIAQEVIGESVQFQFVLMAEEDMVL